MEKAIEKLQKEMEANAQNPYVQLIGNYLIAHLESKPEHAENLMDESKTILKSLDAMQRYAGTKRVGNYAIVSDEEGFQVVLQYFGCWEGEMLEIPPEPQRPVINHTPTRRPSAVQQSSKPTSTVPSTKLGKQLPAGWAQTSLFDLASEN